MFDIEKLRDEQGNVITPRGDYTPGHVRCVHRRSSYSYVSANVTVAVCQTSDAIQMPSGGSTRQIGASVDS